MWCLQLVACNVGEQEQVVHLVQQVRSSELNICGLMHCAGVLCDGLIENLHDAARALFARFPLPRCLSRISLNFMGFERRRGCCRMLCDCPTDTGV